MRAFLQTKEPVQALIIISGLIDSFFSAAAGAGRGNDYIIARFPVGRGGNLIFVRMLHCEHHSFDLVHISAVA